MSGRPFDASYDESTSTLTLSGIVDELSLDDMKSALATASAELTVPVRVDLSEVDFLPSIGLGILAAAMRRCRTRGGEVTLVTRSGTLAARVLEISGLPFDLSGAA
ncbi:STAS domain-containing protein [Nocardioides plantarum]|uniref:STAS domain-containing protein n=1 Tax=Nocardioides plantarum TaxID=29299 RepID=A0ABV5K9J0_9ACTN|nr:STAS domain-containing protein [Nocardioides plantarum]